MSKLLASISNFIRAVASLIAVGLLSVASWFGYNYYNERDLLQADLQSKTAKLVEQGIEIERLDKDNAEKAKRIAQLDAAVRLLKVDHRLAEIRVLDQSTDKETGKLTTRFQFVEVDDAGQPVGEPKTFAIEGDIVHVDGLIVKYLDKYVEGGDPLRGTSAFLFRRIYGEHQEAAKGYPLDPVGDRPAPYGQGTKMSDVEKEVWTNFWDYANNPAKRAEAGIRAVHGEAPYIKLEKKKLYKVQLRASDGVSIVGEDMPSTVKPL